MHYLIAYSSMPEPYGKFVWSPNIENATPFPSSVAAEAKRSTVADAMAVIEHDGRWYIVKE
jgi:hypothetical protein